MAELIHTLLVAGVAGGGATVRPLAKRLENAGAKATVARAPLLRTPSVTHEAEKVRTMILKQPEGLTLFGYSMGGLISAIVLEEPHIAKRVRRLVTYGTPFDGTLIGWPSADMLDRVTRVISDPQRPWSFMAVNGSEDLVAPFPQQNVPAHEALSVPHGHTSLLHDQELQTLIVELLLKGG